MNEQPLREQVEQLHAAIDSVNATEADKARLQQLISDIEQQLANADESDQSHGLVGQLEEMISSFETEHPTVAAVLNNIMVTLSSMGV